MARLFVERLGGIAGLGLPNSRLVSRGSVELDELSSADRAAIARLFAQGEEAPVAQAGQTPPAGRDRQATGGRAPETRDGFVYRLTRVDAGGEQCLEVDEHCLPEPVLRCVRDEFR